MTSPFTLSLTSNCRCSMVAALFAMLTMTTQAQVPMATTGSYTQDFSALSDSGTVAWMDNTTIANWYWQKTSASGNLNVASAGSSSTGAGYSYGAALSQERAMGSIGSASLGDIAWGVLLQNTSNAIITDVTVAYTGEQWRSAGASGGAQAISFYYQVATAPITALTPNLNATWTLVPALSFQALVDTGSAGALNGNDMANRSVFPATALPALSLAPGMFILVKWDDPNHAGADHGLAIDDVTISWATGIGTGIAAATDAGIVLSQLPHAVVLDHLPQEALTVEVLDAAGRAVRQAYALPLGTQRWEISTLDMSSGIHLLRVRSAKDQWTYRIPVMR